MHWCKSDDLLEDFHKREIEGFSGAIQHRELSVAQIMCYCAEEGICPPPEVVNDAAALICELLLHQKCTQRGRNAGPVERYRQDFWDFERWDAVLEIRRVKRRIQRDVPILRQRLRSAERSLNAKRKAKDVRAPELQRLRDGVASHKRRLFFEEKWANWLKDGIFECASRYLAGRDARIGADAMRASYYKVKKALKDPVERKRYAVFEDRFLRNFGFPGVQDRKPGTKSFPLYSITN